VTADLSIDVVVGEVRGIPVPFTTSDMTLISGNGYMYGWSFREATGGQAVQNEGAVVAPVALATIVTITGLAAGTYTVNWTTSLQGAAAAADANNFRLIDTAGTVLNGVNPGVAGEYPQVASVITVPQGSAISIVAIGAGTAAVTYAAEIALTPVVINDALVELQDGGQPLGEIGLGVNQAATVWFGNPGIRISSQIKVHVIFGAVIGVVYAGFDK